MRNAWMKRILRVAVFVALSPVLFAQSSDQPARTPPDIAGTWQLADTETMFRWTALNEDPPLQPWAEERTRANFEAGNPGDPETKCFPSGMPRIFVHQYPIEILQLPGRVIMLFEYDHFVRQIWMDGREHPREEELDHTWMGHSIGSWDGETLVVDSVGFNDKTWLDNAGHPHTEALRVVERIRRVEHDTLQIDFTIDDPKAYTRPWSGQRIFRFRPGWEIAEQVCVDTFLWEEPGK